MNPLRTLDSATNFYPVLSASLFAEDAAKAEFITYKPLTAHVPLIFHICCIQLFYSKKHTIFKSCSFLGGLSFDF